jgi:hypothetical protein
MSWLTADSPTIADVYESNTSGKSDANVPFIDNPQYLNFPEKTANDYKPVECVDKLFVFTVLLLSGFPLIFCDIYFALTDHSCVHWSPFLNLYIYLMVSAFYNMTMLVFQIGYVIICNMSIDRSIEYFTSVPYSVSATSSSGATTAHRPLNITYDMSVGTVLSFIGAINITFTIIWTIVGMILFWTVRSNCSEMMYNYMFWSLIIKMIIVIVNCLRNFQFRLRRKSGYF